MTDSLIPTNPGIEGQGYSTVVSISAQKIIDHDKSVQGRIISAALLLVA